MKLRNKRTGEVGKLHCDMNVVPAKYGVFEDTDIRGHYWEYDSLAELNEEWEDYEEPKTFWAISWAGEPEEYDAKKTPQELKDMAKEIGNYFLSREEAEKVVEKLKAWKRLKDRGFRIEGWTIDDGLRITICTNTDSDGIYDDDKKEMKKDLDLLFEGEE